MDQRREPRFQIDQNVAITVLGAGSRLETGRVINASGRGLAIALPHPIPPGTAIKIEIDDSLVLGEAVYCRATGNSHLVGVELDQVLCGLSQLARKLEEFGDPGAVTETAGSELPPPSKTPAQ